MERGIAVGVDPETARHVDLPKLNSEEFAQASLIIAFGGDGTLIQAAHLGAESIVPILGVYFGRFGFVTQARDHDLEETLTEFLAGRSRFENRMMLQAELVRGGNLVATFHALNEIVLQRAVTARMLTFEVEVDGHRVARYPADGIIVSTPTGSTAYNLSAGGPIVDPNVSAMILTAIAPHTLSARSLILGPDSEICLGLESQGDSVLSADGQTRLHTLAGDVVRVRRSPRITQLVSVEQNDFLVKLSDKLLWSQGLVLGEVDDD